MIPPSRSTLDRYVGIGLVRSQSSGKLTVYNYTEFTAYERLWNSVTRQARGLVLDDSGRVVIRCLPKFFNHDGPEALLEKPARPTSLVVQEKVDGSLIHVANGAEHGLVVTSRGSFQSDHAKWAQEIIAERGMEFDGGLTYVFELIHPDNRIVLDYGDRRELVLLAVVDTDTGVEHDIYTSRFDGFARAGKLEPAALEGELDGEGVVVNYGGYRVKIKTEEYLRLHRIVTNFTPRRVWEALSTGQSLDLENMPEEFQAWLDDTVDGLRSSFAELESDALAAFRDAEHLTDKELGLSDHPFKSYVFALRRGKDIAPAIWKAIRPAAQEKP